MKKLLTILLTITCISQAYTQSLDSLEIKIDSNARYVSITDRFGTICFASKVDTTTTTFKISTKDFISCKINPPIYFINFVDDKKHLVAFHKVFLPVKE